MSPRNPILMAGALVAALATYALGSSFSTQAPQDSDRHFGDTGSLEDTLPATRPSPDMIPGQWFGPGPLHKVIISADRQQDLEQIRNAGGLLRSIDYGSFQLAIVDESAYTGRGIELQKLGFDFRDELDLMVFNGIVLDGRHPQRTLGSLRASERFTDPESLSIDPLAGLYIVQFEGPIRGEELEKVMQLGVGFSQYAPMNAVVVELPAARLQALEALASREDFIQYVGAYEPAFRMHADLREMAHNGEVNLPVAVTIQLINQRGVRDTLAEIEGMVDELVQVHSVGPYVNVQARLHPVFFSTLAANPSVFQIEPRGERKALDERQGQIMAGIVNATGPVNPGYLPWLSGRGFNSSQFGSFSVNVVDDATTVAGHADLPNSRVDFSQNPTAQGSSQGGHGFLNAHIVAGFNNQNGTAFNDGGAYNYGLGIAPWAHVGSTAIFGNGSLNPTSYESSAYASGARISSNSWGFQTSTGAPVPDYNASAQEFDFITRDARSASTGNQEYFVIFAAGNDGSGSNTVSSPSTAKNVLTVGASENNRQTGSDGCGIPNSGANNFNDLASFSSQGPVDSGGGDGRWKPEIVAPGTHIQAGIPQSNYAGGSVCNQFWPVGQTLYGWSSGTSHSTPALAGAAALVRQDFLNKGLAAPSPAMNKAFLVNSARYLSGFLTSGTLPSNSQGMGGADVGRAFDGLSRILVDQTQLLNGSGATHTVTGNVADGGQPFRVTLVWTDAPGPTSGAPFVNNLDLTVTVGGNTYRGNVFSGQNSTTGGSADFRNNTESVFLPAGVSGAFSVTVSASSIGGDGVPGNGDTTDQDFALVIYNASNGPAAPVAAFTGTPTSGNSPLTVNFSDNSSGSPTSWAWNFGDGSTSSAQNPSHIYSTPGVYTVTLDITAPTGSDNSTRTNYITVNTPPLPGISDGSFESQVQGSAPLSPWTNFFGSGHVINPAGGTSSDSGMPTDGTNWLEVVGNSSDNSTPPSNPGGFGNAPVNGAGISQSFSYGAGATLLSFDAAFMRNESANSNFNDWMSVDISDGSSSYNLYYADTFTGTVGTSSKNGFPITAISNVSMDLATIFGGSSTSTLFTLTIQVGNASDNIQPSVGYADNFALTGSGPAAPVANFSGTPTSGTNPLNVNFTDSSTGSITSWAWSFGDGNSSSAQNPSHTYTLDGTYSVTLTVTGPGGSDNLTRTNYVSVTPPAPVAAFTGTPLTGTTPLAVSFSDGSTGSITSWAWTFGDGSSSTLQNPSHTYTSAGNFSVSLTVTGPGGNDTLTRTNYIIASEPAPVASFSGTPVSGSTPLAVNFTDGSTGSITSWAWTFGDGSSSTLQSPGHTYTTAGSFSVSLTVTGPGGSDTLTRTNYITASEPAPVAGFSGTPTSGTIPLAVNFTDSSTGSITSWAWTFGDGASSTLQNPSHTYTTAGSYSVSLTVTGPGGSDTLTRSNYITANEPAPVAGFSGTPLSGSTPLAVNFTDSSSGSITSWAWSFGDGSSSTAQNPSHTYTTAGSFSVSLTVTGPGGSDTLTRSNYITASAAAPVASFSGTPLSGNTPLVVNFTDSSTGSVTSWAWTFGDGTSSSAQNPSHTYTAAGSYSVSLTVTGPGGSDTLTRTNYITASEPAPVASFSGTPTSGTNPLSVSFTDSSSGSITSWAWTFGDGASSTLQNPSHIYTVDGTYSVSLTVTGPGGNDTLTRTNYISVDPLVSAPAAGFSGTPTSGSLPLVVNFTDSSSGSITSWAWSFGDGSSSTLQDPSHTYNTAGSYSVSLTVSGPGGNDTLTRTNYIVVSEPAPVAGFNGTPTSGSTPLVVAFSDTSSGVVSSWAWDFGDGNSSTLQNPSHTYTSAGSYSVALTVTGPGGSDSLTRTGYITASEAAPVAAFNGTPTSGSSPLVVAFSDTSSGLVSSWAWDFGDGNSSTLQNPSHTYTATGNFSVSLTVTGPGGADTLTRTNFIAVSGSGADPLYYLSFVANTTVPGGVGNVADEDIVSFNPVTGAWALVFDGSDVGLGVTDIDGFHVRTDGSILMTFNRSNTNVPGLTGGPSGTLIDDSDIVLFTPSSTGSNTAGSFSFYFDASDVGLTTNSEDVDGIYEFPDGRLLLSIQGSGAASGLGALRDEDTMIFTGSYGSATAGSFVRHFDGSDVGFAASGGHDLDGIHMDGADMLFSTRGSFNAAGASGQDEDIASFVGNFGNNTTGTATLLFDFNMLGIDASEDVDGISLVR